MRKKSLIGPLAVVIMFVLGMPDLYAQQQGANPPARTGTAPVDRCRGPTRAGLVLSLETDGRRHARRQRIGTMLEGTRSCIQSAGASLDHG